MVILWGISFIILLRKIYGMQKVSKWYFTSYVNASNYRKKVVNCLIEKAMTPREIEKQINIKISHISRTLKELKEKGLVECLSPEIRKHKLYSLTKKGKKLLHQ